MKSVTAPSVATDLADASPQELELLFARWRDLRRQIEAAPLGVVARLDAVGAWIYRELCAAYGRERVAHEQEAPGPVFVPPFTCEAEARAAWGDR